MIPSFTKVHNKFKLNRENFSHTQLKDVAYNLVKEGEPFSKIIGDFLLDWLDNKDYILVKTSGSTGEPKILSLKKQAMVNSAIATGNYFNLEPGSKALHCLPAQFIAGKMMFIRAIVLGLELDVVAPSLHPLASIEKRYDFCAMVPMQLQNSIAELYKVKTLIVGGAPVSRSLKEKVRDISTKVFATYGMTETITHIAIKPLNHFSEAASYYKVFPEVSIGVDDRDCLIINAPKLNAETIITNDIVKLHSKTEFEVMGRFDNMINSGGVKLFPEQIEKKLSQLIDKPFFVASKSDDTLGERLVLVIEGSCDIEHITEAIKALANLNKYEIPKEIFSIPQLVMTRSGKILRKQTLELLK